MNAYLDNYVRVLKRYAFFNGRASLAEFWMFVLVNIIVGFLVNVVSDTLALLYSLVVFLPALAVSVRRLHDTGRSAWWLLLAFFPVVGWIVLLVFAVQPSKR